MKVTHLVECELAAPPGAKIVFARYLDAYVPVLVDEAFDHPGKLSIMSRGYVQMTPPGAGRVDLLHRWLLGLTVNDGLVGDHINGDILDNRSSNLRALDASSSSANRRSTASSGHLGVERDPRTGRWRAAAHLGGKNYYLGTFDAVEEAAAVARAWRQRNLPGYVGR